METTRYTLGFSLAALGTLVLACDETAEQREAQENIPSVDKIAEEPNKFYGKRVTIVGEVDDFYGDRAFALEDDMDLIFEDKVLVLTKSPVRFGATKLEDDDEVIVSGTVEPFETAKIKERLEWTAEPVVEIERWDKKPVLIADSVRRINESGRWSEDQEPGAVAVSWTAVYLEPEPSRLVGEPASLEMVEVQRVDGRGLWVGSPAYPVFVVVDQEQNFRPGDWIDVEGKVQSMPSDPKARSEWELSADSSGILDKTLFYLKADKIEKSKKRPAWLSSAIDLKEYAKNPEKYEDKAVIGEAEIGKKLSDQAFYLKASGGEEVLVVVREGMIPRTEIPKLQEGQKIRFTARAQKNTDLLPEETKKEIQDALEKKPGFLTLYRHDVFLDQGS